MVLRIVGCAQGCGENLTKIRVGMTRGRNALERDRTRGKGDNSPEPRVYTSACPLYSSHSLLGLVLTILLTVIRLITPKVVAKLSLPSCKGSRMKTVIE